MRGRKLKEEVDHKITNKKKTSSIKLPLSLEEGKWITGLTSVKNFTAISNKTKAQK